jgi:hypothetical protein
LHKQTNVFSHDFVDKAWDMKHSEGA